MRLCIVFFFIVCTLLACTDKVELDADKALREGEYYKALELYKQCLKNNPSNDAIYTKIEKLGSNIVMHALTLIQNSKYDDAITFLKPILNEPEHCPIDAYALVVIANIYGFPDQMDRLRQSIDYLNQALRMNPAQFKVRNLSAAIKEWLIKHGLVQSDLEGRSFDEHDAGLIYTAFLHYYVNRHIVAEYPVPGFPLPEDLNPKQKESMNHVYSLFSWIVHNIQIVKEDHPLYYPALMPDVLIRGFGTYEECCNLFIFQCLQMNVPAYLVTPRKQTGDESQSMEPLVMVKSGSYFILFDLRGGTPILDSSETHLADMKKLLMDKNASIAPCHKDQIRVEDLRNGIIWIVLPPRSLIPRLSLLPEVFKVFQVTPPPYFYISTAVLSGLVKDDLLEDKTPVYNYLEVKKQGCCISLYPELFERWKLYNVDQESMKKLNEKRKIVSFLMNARMAELKGIQDVENQYQKLFETPPEEAGQKEMLRYIFTGFLAEKGQENKVTEYLANQTSIPGNAILYCRVAKYYLKTGQKELAKQFYEKSGRFSEKSLGFYVK